MWDWWQPFALFPYTACSKWGGKYFFKSIWHHWLNRKAGLSRRVPFLPEFCPPPPSPWCLVKQWELSYASLCKRLRKEMALYRPNDTKNPPKQTWKEREGQAERGGGVGREIPSWFIFQVIGLCGHFLVLEEEVNMQTYVNPSPFLLPTGKALGPIQLQRKCCVSFLALKAAKPISCLFGSFCKEWRLSPSACQEGTPPQKPGCLGIVTIFWAFSSLAHQLSGQLS